MRKENSEPQKERHLTEPESFSWIWPGQVRFHKIIQKQNKTEFHVEWKQQRKQEYSARKRGWKYCKTLDLSIICQEKAEHAELSQQSQST